MKTYIEQIAPIKLPEMEFDTLEEAQAFVEQCAAGHDISLFKCRLSAGGVESPVLLFQPGRHGKQPPSAAKRANGLGVCDLRAGIKERLYAFSHGNTPPTWGVAMRREYVWRSEKILAVIEGH